MEKGFTKIVESAASKQNKQDKIERINALAAELVSRVPNLTSVMDIVNSSPELAEMGRKMAQSPEVNDPAWVEKHGKEIQEMLYPTYFEDTMREEGESDEDYATFLLDHEAKRLQYSKELKEAGLLSQLQHEFERRSYVEDTNRRYKEETGKELPR